MNVNFDINISLEICAKKVERELGSYFCHNDPLLSVIEDAQKYSLLGGGKRIRPYLVLSFCRIFGAKEEVALPLACAMEMVHTYSLIHDDLPCMDNDDYRRGKLTNHKVYGEATAVLAGDALLTKAFEAVASAPELSFEVRGWAVAMLARSSGDRGMIGGQVMDMNAPLREDIDLSYLLKMHALKTGALIRASAKLGCLAAGFSEDSPEARAADAYAENIGLAFQVVDDVLDVIGDSDTLGKKVGVDKASNKLTFMRFYTVDEAKQYARALTESAIRAITPYDRNCELEALALYLLNRKK